MKGLLLELAAVFFISFTTLVRGFTPIECKDETFCAILLTTTSCDLLKESEMQRCPVSCELCDPNKDDQLTSQAFTKIPEITSPFNFPDINEKTTESGCCPKDCVDQKVLYEWASNYLTWLEDYKKWKEDYTKFKDLAESGELCSRP